MVQSLPSIFLLCAASVGFVAAYVPTPHGVAVTLSSGKTIELAVAGPSSFRVSAISGAAAPTQISSLMVVPPASYAAFSASQNGDIVTLATQTSGSAPAFGSISLNAVTGAFTMTDTTGRILTSSSSLLGGSVAGNNTCAAPRVGCDAVNPVRTPRSPNGLHVASQAACCAACDADPDCNTWVWDTQGDNPNCWPLISLSGLNTGVANRVLGGAMPPPPPGHTAFHFTVTSGATFMGSGTDGGAATTLTRTSGSASVNNRGSWTPSFYCTDGWSALAVSPFPNANGVSPTGSSKYGVDWSVSGGSLTVNVLGGSDGSPGVDLYLTPAPTLRDHVTRQAVLEGFPPVPPLYTLGFLACRWGWVNQAYIENVIATFRNGSFPLDAIISDFEWFTQRPDYSLPPQGDPLYPDFGYNNITWGRTEAESAALIARYRSQYNTRFGGIRKPRLGNATALVAAQAKGWLMGQGASPSGKPDGSRNTNYSMPDFVAWYAAQQMHYIADGVAFFWNDEGEDNYFTFSEWSMAQIQTLRSSVTPNARYFSINRAFSPGAARLGVTTWTGDVDSKWPDLQSTPGYILNWGLAGMPWVTCDTGGFQNNPTALILTRWYGVSAFSPIMRVHSVNSATPHFPFASLWGAEASAAMRVHLQTRYALLPLMYALAHEAHATGISPVRPMALVFPGDAAAAPLTAQWMIGDNVLVAPVMAASNATIAYLPAGSWYEWNSTVTHAGPVTLQLTSVPLSVVPVYVRAGSVLPLAPPVQWTDALPGGPLSVVVYSGADGNGTVVDDDGETTAYETGAFSVLSLVWSESQGCVTWSKSGSFAGGPHTFTSLTVTAFTPTGVRTSPVSAISGASGVVCPK